MKDIITAQALRQNTKHEHHSGHNVVVLAESISLRTDRFQDVEDLVERLTENTRALAHATS